MEEIIGPISFSDLNEEGMLVEGFDKDATYIEIYNHPYYVEHMEKLGAYKVVDWRCYRIDVPEKPDPRIKRLASIVAKKNGFKLLDIKYLLKHDKKKLDEYVMKCLDVLDEASSPLFGTSPINEKQKRREMKTIYTALVPELAAIVVDETGEEVVAYGYMMPSMNEVLQKGRGRFFPFGIIPYIKAFKKIEVADMMSIGITAKHKNSGAVAMIIDSCLDGLIQHGVKWIETGPQLEQNDNINNLWKSFNPRFTKRRRCWGLKVE